MRREERKGSFPSHLCTSVCIVLYLIAPNSNKIDYFALDIAPPRGGLPCMYNVPYLVLRVAIHSPLLAYMLL